MSNSEVVIPAEWVTLLEERRAIAVAEENITKSAAKILDAARQYPTTGRPAPISQLTDAGNPVLAINTALQRITETQEKIAALQSQLSRNENAITDLKRKISSRRQLMIAAVVIAVLILGVLLFQNFG